MELDEEVTIENLYMPASNVHMHVVIAVSGFLSEGTAEQGNWLHLINYCRARGLPCYAINWRASSEENVKEMMKGNAEKADLFSVAQGVTSLKDIFTKQKMSTLASYVSSVALDGVETFKTARSNAKVTGKVIAHFLASKGHVFGDQTISLMGFSLGSQVCKSTINRLSKLGIKDLVQNVYLLAGATYIKDSKLEV